jgi:hypothetical protein
MLKKVLMISAIIILGVIVLYQTLVVFGEYYDDNYSYNITLINTATENGELIIEGLLKLNGLKYQKNDAEKLQIRGKDSEKFNELSNLSHTYKNYLIASKNEINEIVTELKEQKLKFVTIDNVEGNNIFILWEDKPK